MNFAHYDILYYNTHFFVSTFDLIFVIITLSIRGETTAMAVTYQNSNDSCMFICDHQKRPRHQQQLPQQLPQNRQLQLSRQRQQQQRRQPYAYLRHPLVIVVIFDFLHISSHK